MATIALTIEDETGVTEVTEDDLYDAGWIRKSEADAYATDCTREHCDENCCGEGVDDVQQALERYHADAGHAYALKFCDVEPCKALVRAGAA